jgi:hypothetical protein
MGHKGITGNELANIEAKTVLVDVIHPTKTYPAQMAHHQSY